MKTLAPLMAACAIVCACDSDPVIRISQPTIDVVQRTYVLTGEVRDEFGSPLAGATAEIVSGNAQFLWRVAETDQRGVFRFTGVSGELRVKIDKAGYHVEVRSVVVSADIGINIRLVRAVLESAIPSDTIVLGQTIRSITNEPPCDAVMWDARAPCRRFDFVSPATGTLVVNIKSLALMDATFVLPFSNTYLETSEEVGSREISITANVTAYERYQLRVNSYYDQQEFNLRAEILPPSP